MKTTTILHGSRCLTCFDLESRASAVFRLKFRGHEAVLSRTQNRNMPDFRRESLNIPKFSPESRNMGQRSRNIGLAQSKHRLSTTYFFQRLNFFQELIQLKLKKEPTNLLGKDLRQKTATENNHLTKLA